MPLPASAHTVVGRGPPNPAAPKPTIPEAHYPETLTPRGYPTEPSSLPYDPARLFGAGEARPPIPTVCPYSARLPKLQGLVRSLAP